MPTKKSKTLTRREMLGQTGKLALLTALAPSVTFGKTEDSSTLYGAVVGDPEAAKVGEQFLRSGGNAIDAAVAAAFAATILSPSKCGIGGYGGHATIALANGKKIVSIDFNSAAPAAARDNMYPLDAKGQVKGNVNTYGWLAAGVPGTLAGLELALNRFGTRSLRDVLAPSIQLCEEGISAPFFPVTDDASRNDPRPDSSQEKNSGAKKQRNLSLAKLLKTLAERNSVDSFYRGDIAKTIAAAFQKNGGLVTFDDMSAYQAREVVPLKFEWNGLTLHTAPLTAPGLMLFEAMAILKKLSWEKFSAHDRLHAKLEALRIAWFDRLNNFGDPTKVAVPVEKFVSTKHIAEMAEKVQGALKSHSPVSLSTAATKDDGTVNISAVDTFGNMIAITLTHGGSFGARVSVEELGLVLGHGMSRFNPLPGHPNSPGSGKRPVNNMCPTIITRGGKPIIAMGGAGGTRIPNSIYEVLLNFVGLGKSLEISMNSPRLDTLGELKLGLEKTHAREDEKFFQTIGYKTSYVTSAFISAVSHDPKTKKCHGFSRGGA